MATIKKAQRGAKMSAKDSMIMYGRRYDSLGAEAAKKMMRGKSPDKDIRAANKARAKETSIAKRLYGTGPGLPQKKKGGKVSKAKDSKWIQKAINPKHKGYCTPMTKPTCTPRRKALAMTLKKMGRARKAK